MVGPIGSERMEERGRVDVGEAGAGEMVGRTLEVGLRDALRDLRTLLKVDVSGGGA